MRKIAIIVITCVTLAATAGSAFAGDKRADAYYTVMCYDPTGASCRPSRSTHTRSNREEKERDRPVQRTIRSGSVGRRCPSRSRSPDVEVEGAIAEEGRPHTSG